MGNLIPLNNENVEKERIKFLKWKNSICCEGNPKKGDSIWNIIMDGPKDSPYMGGKFKIRIQFKDDYPTSEPTFEFLTPICHINIKGTYICLGTYDKKNSSIVKTLGVIFMMLTSPNKDNAFGEYLALYTNNYSGYLKKAREMTREYAKI